MASSQHHLSSQPMAAPSMEQRQRCSNGAPRAAQHHVAPSGYVLQRTSVAGLARGTTRAVPQCALAALAASLSLARAVVAKPGCHNSSVSPQRPNSNSYNCNNSNYCNSKARATATGEGQGTNEIRSPTTSSPLHPHVSLVRTTPRSGWHCEAPTIPCAWFSFKEITSTETQPSKHGGSRWKMKAPRTSNLQRLTSLG